MRFLVLLLLLSLSLRSGTLNSHLLLSLSLSKPTYTTADLLTLPRQDLVQGANQHCAHLTLIRKYTLVEQWCFLAVAVDANADGSTICDSCTAEHPSSKLSNNKERKLFLFFIDPCVLLLVHSLLVCTVVKNHCVMTKVELSLMLGDAFG